MTAIIKIDYDEPNQESYRKTILVFDEGTRKFFDSGDVFLDFTAALKWAKDNFHYVIFSSSVDNFLMDGNKYVWSDYRGLETINLK